MMMKFSKLAQLLFVSCFGLTLFACSNAPKMMTEAMPKSGFLPNYSLLQAVPNTPSGTRVWRYRNEAVSPSAYTAVMIDPIYLNQAPTQNITAESLIQAKIALQDSMIQAVMGRGNIQIVTKPGPGVARISVGITGAEASANSLQPWNFTPIGLATNAAAYAAGVNAKTPALVVENKITDSQSNQLLGEGLITVEGESFRTASGSVESFIDMAKKVVVAALKLSAQQ